MESSVEQHAPNPEELEVDSVQKPDEIEVEPSPKQDEIEVEQAPNPDEIEKAQDEVEEVAAPALSPPLFKTPVPTPTVFEWRDQVQAKLRLVEGELEVMRKFSKGRVDNGANAAPTPKNLRLLKEIEDDEQNFARATTKAAIDAARAETFKAVDRAVKVEQLYKGLDEKISQQEKTAEESRNVSLQSQQELQQQIKSLLEENQKLKDGMKDIHEQLQERQRHGKHMEEALFFLSDEINKNKPAPPPSRGGGSPMRGTKAPATRKK